MLSTHLVLFGMQEMILLSFGVTVSRGKVALWSSAVSVAPPKSHESGVVVVIRVEGNLVGAIPCVETVFFFLRGTDRAW